MLDTDITRALAVFATGPVDATPDQRTAMATLLSSSITRARSAEGPAPAKISAVVCRLAPIAPKEAQVWHSGDLVGAEWAALANAFVLRATGDDDPSAVVVPCAKAVGESMGASDPQLIDAILVGLEIFARVRLGFGPQHVARGWDVIGTAGVAASAAAAARLLGLDAEQTEQAMGLAVTQLAGLQAQADTHAMALHAAKAAFNGIEAARLIAEGLDGPRRILEGRRGAFALACDDPDPASATRDLGRVWVC